MELLSSNMGCVTWIFFGGLVGWVASILTGRNSRMGCLSNIIIGSIGAIVGGLLMRLVTSQGFTFGWDWLSFTVAVIGAVLLLAVTGMYRKQR